MPNRISLSIFCYILCIFLSYIFFFFPFGRGSFTPLVVWSFMHSLTCICDFVHIRSMYPSAIPIIRDGFFFSSFALSPLLSLSLSFAIFLTLSLLWFIMHTYTRVLHAASTGTVCVCVTEYNLRWCANFCTEQYTTKDDICQMCSEKEMKIQMQSDEQWRIRILC